MGYSGKCQRLYGGYFPSLTAPPIHPAPASLSLNALAFPQQWDGESQPPTPPDLHPCKTPTWLAVGTELLWSLLGGCNHAKAWGNTSRKCWLQV